MTSVPQIAEQSMEEQIVQHAKRARVWKVAATMLGLLLTGSVTCSDKIADYRDGVAKTAVEEATLENWRTEAKVLAEKNRQAIKVNRKDVDGLMEGVSAIGELQLQQGEEFRKMLIDAVPRHDRPKYKEKSDTLERAEKRVRKVAVEGKGR